MRYCLLCGAIGFASFAAAAVPAQDDPWLADYAAARRLARVSGKPIFVVFR
jgi:hypothetical protein